ncbi:putative signal peptide protein [Burkholderia cenocepacia]|uniref:Signal peptide protein n=1 Tax=Burkholderia cenocepacia TaxID=95486 RepID=A0AAN0RRX7_9BURK|nr:putative signal peptide protein [Burkholderia cenocepacia]
MSPWSNERLAVGVGTREIVVGIRARALWRRGRRGFVAEPHGVVIPDEQFGSETGLLDALHAALAAARGADVDATRASARGAHVVLDDFWCCHAILRGDFRALHARELEEIALAHFSDTYGVAAESLVARFDVLHGGRALFASALPRTLYDGILGTGASGDVRIRGLRAALPETLNRFAAKPDGDAMLLVVGEALLQAVMVERGEWAAYDAQRLFPGESGDASRLAELAEQLFERSAMRTGLKRDTCKVYLSGADVDAGPFDARFAAAVVPGRAALDGSAARRLLEYAP